MPYIKNDRINFKSIKRPIIHFTYLKSLYRKLNRDLRYIFIDNKTHMCYSTIGKSQ